MTDGAVTFWSAISGGLIAGAASILTAKIILRDQKFNAAADKFRSNLHYELVGLYPIRQPWELDKIDHLYDSLPKVLSMASEFKVILKNKDDFDKVIDEYQKFCTLSRINRILDTLQTEEDEGDQLRREFDHIIGRILSFTLPSEQTWYASLLEPAPKIRQCLEKLYNKIKQHC